jgi:hypothetical protein
MEQALQNGKPNAGGLTPLSGRMRTLPLLAANHPDRPDNAMPSLRIDCVQLRHGTTGQADSACRRLRHRYAGAGGAFYLLNTDATPNRATLRAWLSVIALLFRPTAGALARGGPGMAGGILAALLVLMRLGLGFGGRIGFLLAGLFVGFITAHAVLLASVSCHIDIAV